MPIQPVEFASSGETVRGDLYLPVGDGPFPVVVMAGGWCYVKELRQPQYAEEFVRRGYAALIFDYRRMGASDGAPRQHLDPWDQIDDYRAAIDWVETRSELDSARIGAWGISYSGGHVLVLAAIDPRIRTVVSNVPVVDGYRTMWRNHGTDRFRKLRAAILEERRKRFETGEWGSIPMSGTPTGPDSELATWPLDEVKAVLEELKRTQAPRHEHWSTLDSVDRLMHYDVSPYARRIVDAPVMVIVANDDDITMWDLEKDVFNSIPAADKELVVLPSTSHMTLYSNLTALDLAAKAAGTFFDEHLRALPTVASRVAEFEARG